MISQRADSVFWPRKFTLVMKIKSKNEGFFFFSNQGGFTDRAGTDIFRNAGEVKFLQNMRTLKSRRRRINGTWNSCRTLRAIKGTACECLGNNFVTIKGKKTGKMCETRTMTDLRFKRNSFSFSLIWF